VLQYTLKKYLLDQHINFIAVFGQDLQQMQNSSFSSGKALDAQKYALKLTRLAACLSAPLSTMFLVSITQLEEAEISNPAQRITAEKSLRKIHCRQ